MHLFKYQNPLLAIEHSEGKRGIETGVNLKIKAPLLNRTSVSHLHRQFRPGELLSAAKAVAIARQSPVTNKKSLDNFINMRDEFLLPSWTERAVEGGGRKARAADRKC